MHPRYTWTINDLDSWRSTSSSIFFHTGIIFCNLPIIGCRSRISIRIFLAFDEYRSTPISTLSPIQIPLEFLEQYVHQKLCKWMFVKFRSRRTTWSSMFEQDLDYFCLGRRIHISVYIYIWTFWLVNSEQLWSILHLFLNLCWYGVDCLSITIWQSCSVIDSVNTSSARDSCDLDPLTDLVIAVFREVSTNTVLDQFQTSQDFNDGSKKNWRVSLCVQDLHHQSFFTEFLQWSRDFRTCSIWVDKQRVSQFYHHYWNLTQTLERNQFHFDPVFLKSHCHLMLL